MRASHSAWLWVCLAAAQEQNGQYAGSDACAVCHGEIATQFDKTSHRAIERQFKRNWEGRSCESCHGPGQKHSESADIAQIVNPAKLPPEAENRNCLACHASRPARAGKAMSSHANGQVPCGACHTIHPKPESRPSTGAGFQPEIHPPPSGALVSRRRADQNAKCASCHASAWAEFQRPHTHPLARGAMSCVDCHNPHASGPRETARLTNGNEPACLSCHANLRGPFVFEHAPVRLDGCGGCHVPHGSVNPKLLARAEVRTVCLECHSDLSAASGQTSGGLGSVPPAFHDIRSPRIQACSTCHRKIHGSNVDRSLRR